MPVRPGTHRGPASRPRSASERAGRFSLWYTTGRWRKLRARFLRNHPVCVFCEQAGRTSEATVVDHVVPHRGDQALFWDEANLQALCKACHDGIKQRMEKNGTSRVIGPDGYPVGGVVSC